MLLLCGYTHINQKYIISKSTKCHFNWNVQPQIVNQKEFWRRLWNMETRHIENVYAYICATNLVIMTVTSHGYHSVSHNKTTRLLVWSPTSKSYITGPLWGESTDDRWIPSEWASNSEAVSTTWRHHYYKGSIVFVLEYLHYLLLYWKSNKICFKSRTMKLQINTIDSVNRLVKYYIQLHYAN